MLCHKPLNRTQSKSKCQNIFLNTFKRTSTTLTRANTQFCSSKHTLLRSVSTLHQLLSMLSLSRFDCIVHQKVRFSQNHSEIGPQVKKTTCKHITSLTNCSKLLLLFVKQLLQLRTRTKMKIQAFRYDYWQTTKPYKKKLVC